MDTILGWIANATGIWRKVAGYLPLILGVGTLLSGLAGFCLEFGHAQNATVVLTLLKNLQSDPNMGLVVAGLAALGVHTNHAAHAEAIESLKPQASVTVSTTRPPVPSAPPVIPPAALS
jgi:Na+/glutamate symporter